MRSVLIIKNPVLHAPGGNDKFTTINSFDLLLNPAMINGQKKSPVIFNVTPRKGKNEHHEDHPMHLFYFFHLNFLPGGCSRQG
jgi:hypothetical protein